MNTENEKRLHYRDANTKGKLMDLYLNQYSERELRIYINDIIQEYRPQRKKTVRNISLQELKAFVELYGTPVGCIFNF